MSERFAVKVGTLDPAVPEVCARCLDPGIAHRRRLVFRRSDGTVERVCVAYWPYCAPCAESVREGERAARWMTVWGGMQMLVVVYAVGASLGYYTFWAPSLALLGLFLWLFGRSSRRARALWNAEWARIDEVYKGGLGAAFSFRNERYAERFAAANRG
jgi:hypothetical protein